MKKRICYLICIVFITLLLSNIFQYYCLNNFHFGVNVSAQEREYPEYTDKIMGFGGYVNNKTIFPIKIREINPIGSRGMEYFATLNTTWGFSEIEQNKMGNYEDIENIVILPFKEYDIGVFHKFNGDYVVNADAYELKYSVLGINFKKVIIKTH